jgi:hypothetical protein
MTGIVWLDPVSGSWAQGTAGYFFNTGAAEPSIVAAGLTYSVAYQSYLGNGYAVYGPATPTVTTTYLRQRQSPVRSPSRVRPPVVRQRQRPEVIT